MSPTQPFSLLCPTLLLPGVHAGMPAPAGWEPVAVRPLLVLVGVTGVGKSTTLQELSAGATTAAHFTLLPDRRVLTDSLIIAAMQSADGLPAAPVRDRRQRFAYTRRFRELCPGGMAETLPLLAVDPAHTAPLLIFDGLRGANEVAAACALLPHARYVMLDAPDAVRVVRLLGRGDPFDSVALSQQQPHGDQPGLLDDDALAAAGLESDAAQAIFSPLEQRLLLDLVARGAVTPTELRTRVEIVLEERRNYDPAATRTALLAHAGENALILDTTRVSAAEAAAAMAQAIAAWWPTLGGVA